MSRGGVEHKVRCWVTSEESHLTQELRGKLIALTATVYCAQVVSSSQSRPFSQQGHLTEELRKN